jgi:hypothetical protein
MLNTRERSGDIELLDIKRALAALDVELKLCRLIYLLRKGSTDQPRVPAGSRKAGSGRAAGEAVRGAMAAPTHRMETPARATVAVSMPTRGFSSRRETRHMTLI